MIQTAILPPESLTPVVHLDLQVSPQILSKKFRTVLMKYSWAGGKLIHEKKKSRDTVQLKDHSAISGWPKRRTIRKPLVRTYWYLASRHDFKNK